jgi:hypothetical protein
MSLNIGSQEENKFQKNRLVESLDLLEHDEEIAIDEINYLIQKAFIESVSAETQ